MPVPVLSLPAAFELPPVHRPFSVPAVPAHWQRVPVGLFQAVHWPLDIASKVSKYHRHPQSAACIAAIPASKALLLHIHPVPFQHPQAPCNVPATALLLWQHLFSTDRLYTIGLSLTLTAAPYPSSIHWLIPRSEVKPPYPAMKAFLI